MLAYQRVDAQSIPLLRQFFARQPYRSCDYTAGVTYMWRDYFSSEYAVKEDMLFVRMISPHGHRYHLLPIGAGDPIAALRFIAPDERGTVRLSGVPEEALPALQARFGADIRITETRQWADYLYPREQLETYAGRKLAGQRNHVNRFMKLYGGYQFDPLTAETLPDVRAFLLTHRCELLKEDPVACAEYGYALDVLDHVQALGCTGGILRLPDKTPVGVCLGTAVGDTYYEHVEKALRSIAGASQLLCRECAAHAPAGVVYINREDDMGDEGLRTAKLALHPSALISKYTVIIPYEGEDKA